MSSQHGVHQCGGGVRGGGISTAINAMIGSMRLSTSISRRRLPTEAVAESIVDQLSSRRAIMLLRAVIAGEHACEPPILRRLALRATAQIEDPRTAAHLNQQMSVALMAIDLAERMHNKVELTVARQYAADILDRILAACN